MALLEWFFPSLGRIEDSLRRQETNMSRITETLIAINDQLNKSANEIISKISELETRDYLTNEDKALLSHIKAGAQTLDDIVPDEVVEEAEEEQAAEEEAPAEESDEDTEGEAVDPTEPEEDTEPEAVEPTEPEEDTEA